MNLWAATTEAALAATRQLYVDGVRVNRTRLWWPTTAQWDVNGSSLLSSTEEAQAVARLQNNIASPLELVWTGGCKEHASHCAPGQHSYREARCAVSSVTEHNQVVNVTVVEPCFAHARQLSGCGIP